MRNKIKIDKKDMIKEVFFEIVFIKIKSEKNNFNGRFLDILNKESPKFSLFLMNYLKYYYEYDEVFFLESHFLHHYILFQNYY